MMTPLIKMHKKQVKIFRKRIRTLNTEDARVVVLPTPALTSHMVGVLMSRTASFSRLRSQRSGDVTRIGRAAPHQKWAKFPKGQRSHKKRKNPKYGVTSDEMIGTKTWEESNDAETPKTTRKHRRKESRKQHTEEYKRDTSTQHEFEVIIIIIIIRND